jgi:hypothetical protein
MAGTVEAGELLDVDVQELAGACALIALGRLQRLEPRALASPIRFRIAETIESGVRRASAISAAVIRSRRSSSIARTRSAGVRRGIRLGGKERSRRPWHPSAR